MNNWFGSVWFKSIQLCCTWRVQMTTQLFFNCKQTIIELTTTEYGCYKIISEFRNTHLYIFNLSFYRNLQNEFTLNSVRLVTNFVPNRFNSIESFKCLLCAIILEVSILNFDRAHTCLAMQRCFYLCEAAHFDRKSIRPWKIVMKW